MEKLEASIYCAGGKGKMEIRVDSLSGPLLGTIPVNATSISAKYQNVSCKIDDINGRKDLYLKFVGTEKYRVEIDYFRFTEYGTTKK